MVDFTKLEDRLVNTQTLNEVIYRNVRYHL